MVKVPATPAGITVIRQLVAEGINVNATLRFHNAYAKTSRMRIWRGWNIGRMPAATSAGSEVSRASLSAGSTA
ncbi:transaldolase family protein [Bradyrhizobium sp. BTAi1]|uniref:transaldolase family protein n=1 Tax=Bradyrhizobium sp. (strain BTAi1 / ATCC BAA-1182) TaxID=288000 RepID=UPI00030CFE26|nr:transaldolase family protein [Bradyrhizobium sp. BTAi1]